MTPEEKAEYQIALEFESFARRLSTCPDADPNERRGWKTAAERAWFWTTFYGLGWIRSPEMAL